MKLWLIKTNADYVLIADNGEIARWANADPLDKNPMLYLRETEWDFDEFKIAEDRESFLNEMIYNYDAATSYRNHDCNDVVAEYDDEVGLTGDKWRREGYTISRYDGGFELFRSTDGKKIAVIACDPTDYEHDWAAIIGGADPIRDGWYDGYEPLPSEDILYESDGE